jgi:hypothetical protein
LFPRLVCYFFLLFFYPLFLSFTRKNADQEFNDTAQLQVQARGWQYSVQQQYLKQQSVHRLATGWTVWESNSGGREFSCNRLDWTCGPNSLLFLARGKAAAAWREHPPQSSVEVKERVVLYLPFCAFTAYGQKELILLYVHDRLTPKLQDILSHFRLEEKSTCPLRDLEADQSDCTAGKPCWKQMTVGN